MFVGGGTSNRARRRSACRRAQHLRPEPRWPRSPPRRTRSRHRRNCSTGCSSPATPGVAGHADRASGARGAGSGAFTRPGGGRRPRGQAAGFDRPNLDLIYGTPEAERRRPDAFGRRGDRLGHRRYLGLRARRRGRQPGWPAQVRRAQIWWWNVKHPNTYAEHVATGTRPVSGCERLLHGDLASLSMSFRIVKTQHQKHQRS